MSVSYDAAASDITTSTSDTSMVVTAPTGTGGRLYAIGNCVDARTISPPAGWTQELNDTNGTVRTYVWSRDDDAASTYTFTVSGNFNSAVVSVHRLQGASSNAITSVLSTGPNDTTQTSPTVTTPSDNCMVFWSIYLNTASASNSASKGTERVDIANATSVCFQAVYTNFEATAGNITGPTITTANFGAKRMLSFAVESVGGGGVWLRCPPGQSPTAAGQYWRRDGSV